MKFTTLLVASMAASLAVAAPVPASSTDTTTLAARNPSARNPAGISGPLVAPSLPRPRPGYITQRDYLSLTNDNYQGAVGVPMTVTWGGAAGAVTITLKSESADDLETVGTVASGVWGNSATWTPTTSGTYAFEISDESRNINYSPQFWVSG